MNKQQLKAFVDDWFKYTPTHWDNYGFDTKEFLTELVKDAYAKALEDVLNDFWCEGVTHEPTEEKWRDFISKKAKEVRGEG